MEHDQWRISISACKLSTLIGLFEHLMEYLNYFNIACKVVENGWFIEYFVQLRELYVIIDKLDTIACLRKLLNTRPKGHIHPRHREIQDVFKIVAQEPWAVFVYLQLVLVKVEMLILAASSVLYGHACLQIDDLVLIQKVILLLLQTFNNIILMPLILLALDLMHWYLSVELNIPS